MAVLTLWNRERETQGARTLLDSSREEEIRRRAYEIYLARGEEPGHDVEDWPGGTRAHGRSIHGKRRIALLPERTKEI